MWQELIGVRRGAGMGARHLGFGTLVLVKVDA
jgi:hypothetical protein